MKICDSVALVTGANGVSLENPLGRKSRTAIKSEGALVRTASKVVQKISVF
jgi:hypothetical protein